MEFEGEGYDECDDFEQQFAEELEMVASMDPERPDRYSGGIPVSRRNLSLTSPFQASAADGSSRKRPMEEEDLLHSSDKHSKIPRLEQTTPSHPHTSTNGLYRTPSRRAQVTKHTSLKRTQNDEPVSPSHTSHFTDDLSLTPHTKHTSSTTLTPHKDSTPTKTTPISSGGFRRSLDPSSIEREKEEEMDAQKDSYARMANTTLLDKFETAYQSLRQTQLDNSDDDSTRDHEDDLPSQVSTRESSSSQHKRLYALTRAPTGPHMSVTGSDGTRVFLRLASGQRSQPKTSFSNFQLLSVPISDLRESIEEERRARLIRESDILLQSLQSSIDDGSQVLFDEGSDVERSGQILWVDKYSPHNYTDLLSDDGINRTLLSWLRLWDEVVFNRPVPVKSGPVPTKSGVGGAKGGGVKFTPKGKRFEKRVEFQDPTTFSGQEALDETRRPKIKLALLCGAPGLGKTTLAHVIASHAGYNVVEMNASDDRSPDVFRQRIEAATQMQAVLMATTKPNCLVIDEIDGAPTAAINVLIEFINRKEKTSSKKKGDMNILSRPIICICNDQYAPSLRQLRQHSLLLYFPPIVTSRLASRLHQVTKKESLSTNVSTLIALCEKATNDIRSCLNTIQFIGGKSKDITLGSIQTASIGQKDAQRSLFSLWKEVFQLPTSKKHTLNQGPLRMNAATSTGSHGNPANNLSTSAGRFHHVLTSASATGEYDKVTNGLFENYLQIKLRDPNLEAVSVAQDWIGFHDNLQQHIAHMQDYIFMSYLPFLSVAFHFLFAGSSKVHLKYPNTGYDVFLRTQRSQHLITSLLLEVSPPVRRTVNSTLLVCEILSPLSEIIAPSFRPVSTQLYSSREKQQLTDLVGTMISYSLTYRQERGVDGQYTYVLDPNIEDLCRFPGLPQRRQLSYSAKQLISREVEMEKMRRAENILSSKNGGSTDSPDTHKTAKVSKAKERVPPKQLVPKKVVVENKVPVDFFGRPITPSRAVGPSGRRISGTQSTLTHPLWFKFNEGYSNAVRRPIKIQRLL